MQHGLLVATGGAVGSGLPFAGQRIIPAQYFPYDTFAVNIAGCFLIGILWVLKEKQTLPVERRLMMTGFCGGSTTFSASRLIAS